MIPEHIQKLIAELSRAQFIAGAATARLEDALAAACQPQPETPEPTQTAQDAA